MPYYTKHPQRLQAAFGAVIGGVTGTTVPTAGFCEASGLERAHELLEEATTLNEVAKLIVAGAGW